MKKILLGAVFAVLLCFSISNSSEAVLWDLIILANVENQTIFPNDTPIISGQVVDQAGKPVQSAKIQIRTATDSLYTNSDNLGKFKAELGKSERTPGIYAVNIIAKSFDGKTGISNVEFQVKGELYPYSDNERKLSTPEAQKYLNSKLSDWNENPIGTTLYHYYQGMLKEYLGQKKVVDKLSEEQLILEEKRILAMQSRNKNIEEFKPGPGIYSGFKYETFVDNLDPSVKGIIVNQLNYTTNSFLEAQKIMDHVLKNGGTYEEARKAYLDRLSMPRELLDAMTTNQTTIQMENQTETSHSIPNNSTKLEKSKKYSIEELMVKEGIEIRTTGDSILINMNDTSLKFILNGTEFIQVEDNENNIDYSCTLANNFLICPKVLEEDHYIAIEHGNRFTECNASISNVTKSSERRGTVSLGLDSRQGSEILCPAIVLENVNYHITGNLKNN